MKTLILANGNSYDFADESTIIGLKSVFNSFAEVDSIREDLTQDNLEGATFDGVEIKDIIPVYVNAIADLGGNVTVTFINREKSDVEKLREEVAKLNSNVDYIAMATDVELED